MCRSESGIPDYVSFYGTVIRGGFFPLMHTCDETKFYVSG